MDFQNGATRNPMDSRFIIFSINKKNMVRMQHFAENIISQNGKSQYIIYEWATASIAM
jgi:hypothetical protein